MLFKLTDQEGQRLVMIMLAMRPDWTPNKPGLLLHTANTTTGFPAADFDHCIRSLAHYATARDHTGAHAKRTPNLYPEPGAHWTATAPENHQPPPGPPCQDHEGQDGPTCRSCWADVKTGDRPAALIGKHHTPESDQP